jgi:hypothetical protein
MRALNGKRRPADAQWGGGDASCTGGDAQCAGREAQCSGDDAQGSGDDAQGSGDDAQGGGGDAQGGGGDAQSKREKAQPLPQRRVTTSAARPAPCDSLLSHVRLLTPTLSSSEERGNASVR